MEGGFSSIKSKERMRNRNRIGHILLDVTLRSLYDEPGISCCIRNETTAFTLGRGARTETLLKGLLFLGDLSPLVEEETGLKMPFGWRFFPAG
jgi:hypothetical protein